MNVLKKVTEAVKLDKFKLLLTRAFSIYSIAVSFFCLSCSTTNAENKRDGVHLSELPPQEQFAHRSLMAKWDLLRIHSNYLMEQRRALLQFMRLIEESKSEGMITDSDFSKAIEKACFPNINDIKHHLEDIKNNNFVGFKAKHCLELLANAEENAVSDYFLQLEDEILNDIDCYARAGIDLPQYKCMVESYTNSRKAVLSCIQFLIMMNPDFFEQ